MVLYIKNMVCNRCIKVVSGILCDLQIAHGPVLLGEVPIKEKLSPEKAAQLQQALEQDGFELIDDKKTRIIEQVKKCILHRIAQDPEDITDNLSDFLTSQLHLEYSYLSALFSSVEGITIEKWHIAQKIEKAKELLVYDEMSLSEIAFNLGYSSVQHLSNQFKKVTGLTPSHFREVGASRRKPIDKVK